MATAQSTNDLTRQQLDELDALLQKMLALPLNTTESATPAVPVPSAVRSSVPEIPLPDLPASRAITSSAYAAPIHKLNGRETNPPTVWRGDSPSSQAIAPQLLTMPSPSAPPPVVPAVRRAPNTLLQALEQPAAATSKVGKGEPATNLLPNSFHLDPAVAPTPNSAPILPIPVRPASSSGEYVSPILVPLVVFNRWLDAALGKLGLAGRLIRSSFGKNMIALAGLLLLTLTAAKIAQLMGWVTLSTTLPWPT